MTTPQPTPAEAFAKLARDYGDFLATAAQLPLLDRLEHTAWYLGQLYTAALGLPLVDRTNHQAPVDQAPSHPTLGFGDLDLYWRLFDPDQDSPPVAGSPADDLADIQQRSLTDDLADIHQDLAFGLQLFDQGTSEAVADATWRWRSDFESYWGRYALSALTALHAAIAEQRSGHRPRIGAEGSPKRTTS
jgi:hypothetical protein